MSTFDVRIEKLKFLFYDFQFSQLLVPLCFLKSSWRKKITASKYYNILSGLRPQQKSKEFPQKVEYQNVIYSRSMQFPVNSYPSSHSGT